MYQAPGVREKEHRWQLGAGGNAPLRNMTERERGEPLKPWRLPRSGRLTDEPDQRVLVGHKVSLQDGYVARIQTVDRHALEP